jgi:uncharacterized protein YbjQ (UPF0145 family)
MNCPNCNLQINPTDKFCGNCGIKFSANQGINKMKEIIVSTGEIKRDYDVLRPIHIFHHSLLNKEVFGDKNISFDEVIDKMIEEIKDEAEEDGGDAILFLRIDFEQMQLGGTQYFVYGTLVKFK